MYYPPFYILLFLISYLTLGICIEPVTTIAAALGAISISVGYAGYDLIKCKRYECCDTNWINLNYLGK